MHNGHQLHWNMIFETLSKICRKSWRVHWKKGQRFLSEIQKRKKVRAFFKHLVRVSKREATLKMLQKIVNTNSFVL